MKTPQQPPKKPRWKKWVLVAAAAASFGVADQALLDGKLATLAPPPEKSATILIIGNEISAQFNIAGNKVTDHQALLPEASGNDFLRMNDDQLLRSASLLDEKEIVQYLIAKGADVHANNEEALRNAVMRGNTEMTQYLLSKGAIADQKMIDDAQLIETTADLSMPMTKALKAALPRGERQ